MLESLLDREPNEPEAFYVDEGELDEAEGEAEKLNLAAGAPGSLVAGAPVQF